MPNSNPPGVSDSLDPHHFRRALAQFATGVTVVTARSASGDLVGLTATSFNSVSLTPPLVLWSLANTARSLPVFQTCSHYVINVLGTHQAHLGDRFARRIENRFEGVDIQLSAAGLPIVNGAAAWFECRNRSQYPEGDHVILVGEVEHCAVNPQAPLIFHGGKFITPTIE